MKNLFFSLAMLGLASSAFADPQIPAAFQQVIDRCSTQKDDDLSHAQNLLQYHEDLSTAEQIWWLAFDQETCKREGQDCGAAACYLKASMAQGCEQARKTYQALLQNVLKRKGSRIDFDDWLKQNHIEKGALETLVQGMQKRYQSQWKLKADPEIPKQAFALIKEAAKQGDPEALYELASAHEEGFGTNKDPVRAQELYEQSAHKGFGPAYAKLAIMKASGVVGAKDLEEARRLWVRYGELSNPKTQFYVAQTLHQGLALPLDHAQACKIYRQIAPEGEVRGREAEWLQSAQLALGVCLQQGIGLEKDVQAGLKFLQWADRASTAPYILARTYREGLGVKKDEAQAGEFLQKAFKQSEPLRYAYAVQQKKGAPEPLDLEEAIRICLNQAQSGDAEAQLIMADLYRGFGSVPAVRSAQHEWLEKSALQLYPEAMYDLALALRKGESGYKRDLPRALAWFTKAAQKGHTGARYQLGTMYGAGEGVETDLNQARHWFELAAEDADPHFKYEIGRRLKSGDEVAEDPTAAAKWLDQASQAGHVKALYELACLYDDGEGVPQDKTKANAMFQSVLKQVSSYESSYKDSARRLRANGVQP